MTITSLEILHLVNELQKFVGKRVDNVTHDGKRAFLKISSGVGIEIREDALFESPGFDPEKHSNFEQLLKKHIKSRKILAIEQHNFDRIVVVKFSERILVIELFHNGNMILADSQMKIIAATDERHWKDRSIIPGAIYKFPENANITNMDSFFSSLEREEKIVSFLVKNGFGFYAEGILERCEIEKSRECRGLSSDEKGKVYAEMMSLLKKDISPSVEGGQLNLFGHGNMAVSDAISKMLEEEEFTVEDQRKIAVRGMEEKEKELRKKAEKIYEKFGEITPSKSGEVEIDDMKIKLDRNLSLEKNAGKYFDEAKKIRGKISRASMIEIKKGKPVIIKQKNREWYHKFKWFFTSDSFLVIAGKDAKTNNDIIRKHVEANDIVIHAEIHGAAFAVIKCKNAVTKNAIEEAMQFAACNSKAWAMGIGSVDVYWVKPDQVKSGLGTGTFNIVGEKNYIRRMELKMGAGFVDGEFKILPFRTFENMGIRSVPVYTGDIKSRELAKKIKDRMKQVYIDKQKEIEGMPLEAIESKIPYARGSI